MMKCLLSSLLILAMVFLHTVSSAQGCAPVMRKGGIVRIATESALIIYDDKTKTEHFIRRGNFQTDVPYFGFLVPTPTKPDLGDTPDDLFTTLADWTKPKIKHETRILYYSLFDALLPQAGMKFAAKDAAEPKGLQVVGRQRVGNFDATILLASDRKELEDWLQKHGYDARKSVMDWLDHYIKEGWFLTAFQMVKPEEKVPGLDSQAVRMSFKTNKPFYPYREPADQREGLNPYGNRLLRVFFVGTGRMEGKLDDDKVKWQGRTVWAEPLAEGQIKDLERRLEKGRVQVPAGAWMTEFEDAAYPRPGTADLFFSLSEDQTDIERPPIIYYTDVHKVNPGEVIGLSVGGGAIALGTVFLVWRLLRRKAV